MAFQLDKIICYCGPAEFPTARRFQSSTGGAQHSHVWSEKNDEKSVWDWQIEEAIFAESLWSLLQLWLADNRSE